MPVRARLFARDAGLAGRTNTVLQTCFFAISGVLEREEAIERIKASIAKTYGKRGAEVVERNQTAVDRYQQLVHDVGTSDGPDLAVLSVTLRVVQELAQIAAPISTKDGSKSVT